MLSLPIGNILVALVIFLSLKDVNLGVFLNSHAIIIVAGGTLAVLIFSSPFKQLVSLFKAIHSLYKKQGSEQQVWQDLVVVSKNKQNFKLNNHYPLLEYAKELWAQGVEKDVFEYLIEQKLADEIKTKEAPATVLKNLAKYPPALGMTGTVMGLVGLFSDLNSDNKEAIGPSLAFAMTATFYGLVLANLVIMPLADRLYLNFLSHVKTDEMICHFIMLINRDEPIEVLNGNQKVA